MKIGIISFAHPHAYSYASCLRQIEDVHIVAIADDAQERGRTAAERYGAKYYHDFRDMLREDIDAVIVCNENVKHKEAVIAAAQAGKHILCEKPIATTIDDAWEMIQVCKENRVKLQIAFPVRFNPPIQRVKQMIDSGTLGRIVAIRGTNRGQNPGGWFIDRNLSGGGAVLDHTVHVIDLMRWFMNSEVKEVFAEVDTRFSDVDIDDCGLLLLEFENGVIASHDPSWSRCKTFPTWGDVTLEIVGTEGVINVDAFSQHLLVYNDEEHRVRQEFWGNDMNMGLIQDFISCIRENREPSITGEDGLRAMQVALAAYESAEKKQPISLQFG